MSKNKGRKEAVEPEVSFKGRSGVWGDKYQNKRNGTTQPVIHILGGGGRITTLFLGSIRAIMEDPERFMALCRKAMKLTTPPEVPATSDEGAAQ